MHILAVKSTSQIVTNETLALQMKLYRLFSLQLFIMIVFMLVGLTLNVIKLIFLFPSRVGERSNTWYGKSDGIV